MYLVTIFGASILVKKEYEFETPEESVSFLKEEKFVFDYEEENVQYWSFGEDTFALIEKN